MMINRQLFIIGVKSGWKALMIFSAVLAMYFIIIIEMFDPDIGQVLIEFEKAMPELMAMFGMENTGSTLIGFLSSYLYGFLMPLMPMIFIIILTNRMIAHYIDSGSMAYLLAAPVKRVSIVMTQMAVLLSGIFVMVIFCTILGLAYCEIRFPGELDISVYLMMNLGVFTLHLFIAGICFIFSCIFNEVKYSLAFGAGINILAYLFQMVRNFGSDFENIKYLTFFSLYSPKDIVDGNTEFYWGMIILTAGALILFSLSVIIFKKKDIPV